jgi:hypothetical protein
VRMVSPKSKKESKVNKISVFAEKIIVDLKMKGLSFNEIIEHLRLIHQINVSSNQIRSVLINLGKKAKRLNNYYDSLAAEKIKIAETDEIYQGREGMFIGTVDKQSTYLMNLSQFSGKSYEEFSVNLRPVAERYPSIQIMITDGFPTYIKSVNDSLPNVVHIICHVHTYRDVMREQDIYKRRARKAYKRMKECRDELVKKAQSLHHNQLVVIEYNQLLIQKEKERDIYYQQHKIPKYSKKKGRKSEKRKFANELNLVRSTIRSYQKAVNSWTNKILQAKTELLKLEIDFQKKKNEALQTGRLVAEFKRLLDCSHDQFEVLRQNLFDKLSKSSIPLAKSLIKTLKNKPHIFADKSESIQQLITSNYMNTNTIESIFGRYRLFFRKYRRITNTKLSCAIFEILRLKHNLSRPYTGINNQTSPIQRLKIQTKFQNYLQSLFPAIFIKETKKRLT